MSSTTAPAMAMTTPFVPPPGCADQFLTTSLVHSWDRNTTTTTGLFVSGPADGRFAACQPSGWKQEDNLQFSPAVCPSAWTAYSLRASIFTTTPNTKLSTSTRLVTISTAYCCSSGFTLTYTTLSNIPGFSHNYGYACFQDITRNATGTATSLSAPFADTLSTNSSSPATAAAAGSTTTTTSSSSSSLLPTPTSTLAARLLTTVSLPDPTTPTALRVHNAWHISWAASDIPSLSPTPPQFACPSSGLSTWVPGATVDPHVLSAACRSSSSSSGSHGGSVLGRATRLFLYTGLPIIVVGLIIILVLSCCRRSRIKHRRVAKRRAMAEQEGITLQELAART